MAKRISREEARQYRHKRWEWTLESSEEKRLDELVIALGSGIVGGVTGGVMIANALGGGIASGIIAGVLGSGTGGLFGYFALVVYHWFRAPAEMAHAAKIAEQSKAKTLAEKFDVVYVKVKQELDEVTRDLDLLRNERRGKIAHLEAIRTSVQGFLDTRDTRGEGRARACAIGLAKHLVGAIEYGLYAAPIFSEERYATVGCDNTDTLYRNVGSLMRHNRGIKIDPPWSYEKTITLFQQHFIEDIDKAIEIERSFLPD